MSVLFDAVKKYHEGAETLDELTQFLVKFDYQVPERISAAPSDPFALESYLEGQSYEQEGTWEEVNALFNLGWITPDDFHHIQDAVYHAKKGGEDSGPSDDSPSSPPEDKSGTSEGAKLGWEHRHRTVAQSVLDELPEHLRAHVGLKHSTTGVRGSADRVSFYNQFSARIHYDPDRFRNIVRTRDLDDNRMIATREREANAGHWGGNQPDPNELVVDDPGAVNLHQTIQHEVGHHVLYSLLPEQREHVLALIKKHPINSPVVSRYKGYAAGTITAGVPSFPEERIREEMFAEAVRWKQMNSPLYSKNVHPAIRKVIDDAWLGRGVLKSGTSEGARLGWEHRERSPHVDDIPMPTTRTSEQIWEDEMRAKQAKDSGQEAPEVDYGDVPDERIDIDDEDDDIGTSRAIAKLLGRDVTKRSLAHLFTGGMELLEHSTVFPGEHLKMKFAMEVSGESDDGSPQIHVQGEVHDHGQQVAWFSRFFQREHGRLVVDHSHFTVDLTKSQGSGYGSAMFYKSEQGYRKLGVSKIRVEADIDVGGYAWARMGFDFESNAGRDTVIDSILGTFSKLQQERYSDENDPYAWQHNPKVDKEQGELRSQLLKLRYPYQYAAFQIKYDGKDQPIGKMGMTGDGFGGYHAVKFMNGQSPSLKAGEEYRRLKMSKQKPALAEPAAIDAKPSKPAPTRRERQLGHPDTPADPDTPPGGLLGTKEGIIGRPESSRAPGIAGGIVYGMDSKPYKYDFDQDKWVMVAKSDTTDPVGGVEAHFDIESPDDDAWAAELAKDEPDLVLNLDQPEEKSRSGRDSRFVWQSEDIELSPEEKAAHDVSGENRDYKGRFATGGARTASSITEDEMIMDTPLKGMPGLGWLKQERAKRDNLLTENESDEVGNYVGSMYGMINGTLRYSRKDSKERGLIQESVDRIDSAFARMTLGRDITVARGMRVNDFIANAIRMGQTFVDHGYVSTTVATSVAWNFSTNEDEDDYRVTPGAPMVMAIHVPKGSHFLPGSESESEVILPRDSQFKVTAFDAKRNRAELEYLGPASVEKSGTSEGAKKGWISRKTSWAHSTISKEGARQASDWVNAKRKEFEASTGVKWSSFSAGGSIHFQPVLNVKDITPDSDPAKSEQLLSKLSADGANWMQLAEETGMDLAEVMAVGLHLTRSERAIADVNRTGQWAYLRAKPVKKSEGNAPVPTVGQESDFSGQYPDPLNPVELVSAGGKKKKRDEEDDPEAKSFDESEHPRGEAGRFESKESSGEPYEFDDNAESDHWLKSMTSRFAGEVLPDEKRAAVEYKASTTSVEVNKQLRDGNLSPKNAELVSLLDKFVSHGTTDRAVTVHRTVGTNARGESGEAITFGDELVRHVGATFVDKSFVSTSAHPEIQVTGDLPVLLDIVVPKGTRAMPMDYLGDKEGELLLPRNTRFRVKSAERAAGTVYAVLEVVP